MHYMARYLKIDAMPYPNNTTAFATMTRMVPWGSLVHKCSGQSCKASILTIAWSHKSKIFIPSKFKLTLAFKLLAQLQLVTLSFLRHDFCSNSSTRCHVSSWRAIYPIVQLQTSKKQAMKALPNKWLVAVARWLLRWKSPMNLTYRMNP